MTSRVSRRFWREYQALPRHIQAAAVKQYQRWREDPHHPSLQFKQVLPGRWSVRITRDYRALASVRGDDVLWVWIGTHAEYDHLLRGR